LEKERSQCYICSFEALSQGEFRHHLKYKHKIIWKKVTSTTFPATTPPIRQHQQQQQCAEMETTPVSLHSTTTLQQQQQQQQQAQDLCSDVDPSDHSRSPLQKQQLHFAFHDVDPSDYSRSPSQQQPVVEADSNIVLIKEEIYDCVLSDDEDFDLDQDFNGDGEFAGDDQPVDDDPGDNEVTLLAQLHAQESLNDLFVKLEGFCCKFCSSFKTTDRQQMKTHQSSCSLVDDTGRSTTTFKSKHITRSC
jgi:hypothetical protein